MGRPPSNGGPSFRFNQTEVYSVLCFNVLLINFVLSLGISFDFDITV